jgi:hypothetical protein
MARRDGGLLRPELEPSDKSRRRHRSFQNAEVEPLRDWKVDRGDVRGNPEIAREILGFIEENQALSVVMTDGIIGCPHQEGIDYEGEWCPDPACEFWHGRNRFTRERVH